MNHTNAVELATNATRLATLNTAIASAVTTAAGGSSTVSYDAAIAIVKVSRDEIETLRVRNNYLINSDL